jgi:hypothetical protein
MLRIGGGHGASAPLPTLRTKPDFSKKAGRFLRWRKKLVRCFAMTLHT